MTMRECYAHIYSLVRELNGLEFDLADLRADGWGEHHAAYRAAAARKARIKSDLDFYSDVMGYGHIVDAAQSSLNAYETWHAPYVLDLPQNKIGTLQMHSANPPTGDRYYAGLNARFSWNGNHYERSEFQPWQINLNPFIQEQS